MGFLQRFLGIERRPGEPAPVDDDRFEDAVGAGGGTAFVLFYSLWCAQCQVLHGLLNELGPVYADRARFLRIDVSKNPRTPAAYEVRGVPQVIAFRGGRAEDRLVGLLPIDELAGWIEGQIAGDNDDTEGS